MNIFSSSFGNLINLLGTIKWHDYIDILIVAYIIYVISGIIRKNNSFNLTKGIIVVFLIVAVADALDLIMIKFVLKKALELGLISLVILFQPEIRKFLERVGRRFTARKHGQDFEFDRVLSQLVLACNELSESKTGALVIIERTYSLNEVIGTGTIINADMSSELLKNIFYDKAPLHDGAVIVRDGRIAAAGCILPLSHKTNLSKELGMRHRAGIGISEQTDAVVVIVSEETGSISVSLDGMLKRHLSSETLLSILKTELATENAENESYLDKMADRIVSIFKKEENNEENQ